jgi:hypothetical protein
MPRRSNSEGSASAFQRVQQQARSLLLGLRKEIRAKEAELKHLKDEESSLGRLTGNIASVGSSPSAAGSGSGRIDWSTVLEQLPKQFNAAHIRSVRGLKNKRSSEIFAAITRWIEAGTVKRRSRGVYERA